MIQSEETNSDSRPSVSLLGISGYTEVRQAHKPIKVYYSGVRCFSTGLGSEQVKDPEARHDPPLLSPKLVNPQSIETSEILHSKRNASVMIQSKESTVGFLLHPVHGIYLPNARMKPQLVHTLPTAPKLDISGEKLYSGVRRFSSGRGSEEVKDPEAGNDQPLLSPKFLNPQPIEKSEILHRDARLLLQKLPIIQGRCIDESYFHWDFDPVEYCRCYPILEVLPISGSGQRIPGSEQRIPGSEQHFLRITDDGLILFRSLAVIVNSLHETGYCFSEHTPLNLGNIAVSSEGKFRVRSDLTKFVPIGSSDGGVILADFESVAAVIKELLVHLYGAEILNKLPLDNLWWFDILEMARKYDGHFICHPVSLLPLRNRANAFLKFYQVIMDINAKDKLRIRQILRLVPAYYNSGGCRHKGWHEIASDNAVIGPRIKGNSSYFKTRIGEALLHRNCYIHRENSPVDPDFLLYALYPDFLCRVQQSFWLHGEKICVQNDFSNRKRTH